MSEDLNTKSLGEKLHDAQSRGVDGPSWSDYSQSERAWTEKVALAFAASLSHDETANAVITDLRQRLQAAEERAEKVEGAWSWLASNTNLELDHRYLDEDDHGGTWRVHRVNGNVNDREWTLVSQGRTPLDAVLAARAALKTGA